MLKTAVLTKLNINYLVKFLILLILATAAPLLGFHSQWVTGPIVNAVLILAVFMLGIRGALLIGLLPSTIALSSGLLPAVLSPMIPFIIISNSILVLVIDWFNRQESRIRNYELWQYWIGLFFGSGLKYLFLYSTSGIVIGLLLKSSLAPAVASVLSWPQFFTAFIGGAIAFAALKVVSLTGGDSAKL